ncbi:MAG: glycosyltransferase family 2 protein [Saprospiraceae bacterium]|nr:glycosyltransferase family 2 protein [Saprospiraceae bacterium]
MSLPLVSIIVPVYNARSYLSQCIESVIHQSYPHWELLLINDGSTDGSLQICRQYACTDSRVKVTDIPNGGVSNARNIGIENAEGEFLMFIDADDWIEPDTLVKCIEFQTNDRADIVLFNYVKIAGHSRTGNEYFYKYARGNPNPEQIKKRSVGLSGEELKHPTKTDALNTPWAKLYKKSVIGNIRYIERSKVGMEDVLFNIEVFQSAQSFSFIEDSFYNYRLDNPDSLTKTDTKHLGLKFENLFSHIENSSFYNASLDEYFNNRVSCSLINICLSLTNKNNRTDIYTDWKYLNSVLNSARYKNALKNFNFRYMPVHWKIFFFAAKYRLTTLLFLISYGIRIIK